MVEKYISVGKILNFHGIKGGAKVGFTKGQEDFVTSLEEVFVQDGTEYLPLSVESSVSHKNFALMKFKGINSIDELMEYKGKLIFVKESYVRETLDEDEFLIDELVGLSVYDDEGKKLGFVVGVSNNGASDLLSVKTNSGNISLVPFVKAIILGVSIKEKKITINNLKGLLE